MQSIKTTITALSITVVLGLSVTINAQEEAADQRTAPIQNKLEIESTIEEFQKQYVEYSIDPEESRRYLKLIRSNRELSQKVQERELVLKMNEQQIELLQQAQLLKNINSGTDDNERSQSSLDLTGFVPEQTLKNQTPVLQSIRNGKLATFTIGKELTTVQESDVLPTGEVVQSISEDTVTLKTRTGTRTLRGMPLGE